MLTIKEDGNTWQANLVISKALCEDELESIYVCKRGIVPRDPSDVKSGIETDMLDVTELSLSDLEEVRPSSLGRALRRVVAQDKDPADPVVGFQASI